MSTSSSRSTHDNSTESATGAMTTTTTERRRQQRRRRQFIEGNLIELALEGQFDVIIHGCNCFCTMGKGIAKSIKTEFPEAYAADCSTKKGCREKLGTFSFAEIDDIVGPSGDGQHLIVVNAYTQYNWRTGGGGGGGTKVDYHAIRQVMKQVKRNFSGKRIGYPLIGAGLAGGDWNIISSIIDAELEGEDHVLVKFRR